MRTAQDTITTANFLPGADIYLGYVPGPDGRGHGNYASMAARFPTAIHGSICTAFNATGQILDFEWSTTGNDGHAAVSWVQTQRAHGANPSVYVARSNWAPLRLLFAALAVVEPPWWIADWTDTPHLLDGAACTQWRSVPGLDYSVVADYWPGIDPAPVPQPLEDDDMYGLPHVMVKASAANNALLLYPNGYVQPVLDGTGTAYEQAGCPVIMAGDAQFAATLARAGK